MAQQNELNLQAVLSDRLFTVPDYQRPYAWETKQLTDLWEDLDLLGPDGAHYAGTLVVRDVLTEDGSAATSMDDAGRTFRRNEVVDGQQRLTTCLILLDRVRRRLTSLGGEGVPGAAAVAERIGADFGHVTIGGVKQPRLTLGMELKSFWKDTILGAHPFSEPTTLTGQRRLFDAVKFFDDRITALVDGVTGEEALDRLKELQRRVTAGLRFLVYEASSAAEVGVIFETLNERGRPLSDLEKTKNYLLYLARQLPAEKREHLAALINDKWSGIFNNLSGRAAGMEDQLLRAHWLATVDPDARTWHGIASIKTRFDRSRYVPGEIRLLPVESSQEASWDQLHHDVEDYVRTLHECSLFLAEALDPDAEFVAFESHRDEARARSLALQRSGVVAIYRPLLFASRLARPADGAFYAGLVDLCERYSARVFVIAQRRANAGQTRLFRLANDLYKGANPALILSEIRAVLWRYGPDERLREMFDALDENWYVRRGHKYFLYEYELSLRSGKEAPMPFSEFTGEARAQRTTEHILPQKPHADASCWWDHFSEEDHKRLRHALGNLVLTYDNSVYSNKCFHAKRGEVKGNDEGKACYAEATLLQERELAKCDKWTATEIEERQRRLADWALERWKVERPEGEDVEEQEAEPEIEAEGLEEEFLV